MLQANQRQPCGSVVQVFWDAIPEWNVYESQKGWIVSGKSKVSGKSNFEADMKYEPRWAITAPAVKGAVGLVLYAILAYFPGLSFLITTKKGLMKSGIIVLAQGHVCARSSSL